MNSKPSDHMLLSVVSFWCRLFYIPSMQQQEDSLLDTYRFLRDTQDEVVEAQVIKFKQALLFILGESATLPLKLEVSYYPSLYLRAAMEVAAVPLSALPLQTYSITTDEGTRIKVGPRGMEIPFP